MLFLYAITDARPPLQTRGLGGVSLELIRSSGLAAVASEHEGLNLVADEDALWEHERVVEALMDDGAVLPMRFGSVLESEEDVRSLLASRASEFRRALDRIRGAVEVGVRVTVGNAEAPGPMPESEASGPGTAYMLDQLARTRRRAEVATQISDALTCLARNHVSRATAAPARSLNVAYLVERERVDEFVSRASELEHQLAGTSIVCTGPWPPYSFTSAEDPR
jgi:hypothetical protein